MLAKASLVLWRLGQHNLKHNKSVIFPPLEVRAILETHGIWSF